MDVTCDRCNTRYEFDEALVSSRGTTVKCTQCGHQFKVYRPQGAAQLDGWTIRTTDGRELKYDAMRKLQAAIANGAVQREDVLIPNDGGEPRRLGKIEELQSFFREEDSDELTQRRSVVPMQRTAPGHRTSSYPPKEEPLHAASPSMAITRVAGGKSTEPAKLRDRDGEVVPARTGNTLRPPLSSPGMEALPPEPPTLARAPAAGRGDDAFSGVEEPATRRRSANGRSNGGATPSRPLDVDAIAESVRSGPGQLVDTEEATNPRARQKISDEDTIGDDSVDDSVVAALARVPAPRGADDSEYPIEEPAGRDSAMSLAPLTPSPSAARPSILRRSVVHSDPRFSTVEGRGKQPGLARLVVGVIAVGVLAIGGYALVQRYAPQGEKPQPVASDDGRLDAFLQEGDKRLFDGDVEGAKDQYIKASALAPDDVRVSRALARIEIIRADLLWLHTRLFAEDDPHRKGLESQLKQAITRAKSAGEAATKQAPDDPLSVGLQIDLLRLDGQRDQARQLVSKLDGAGPDAARALALLDLLEQEPSYGSVIDRLRSAARAERKLARSQALLVFALVRAGRKDEADKELLALASQNPTHPLLPPLRAFVDGTAQPEPEPEPVATTPPPPPPAYTGRVEPDHAEPFATAEPDVHELLGTTAEPPSTGEAPPEPTAPPIDTSDLQDLHE